MRKKTSFLFALAVMAATVAAVWFANRPASTRQADWQDVVKEAEVGGYRLITTEELASRYGKNPGGFLLVDTRQEWEFRTGHIKGALNFPMEPTRWARWRKAGDLEAFLGPDKERDIVFY